MRNANAIARIKKTKQLLLQMTVQIYNTPLTGTVHHAVQITTINCAEIINTYVSKHIIGLSIIGVVYCINEQNNTTYMYIQIL